MKKKLVLLCAAAILPLSGGVACATVEQEVRDRANEEVDRQKRNVEERVRQEATKAEDRLRQEATNALEGR